MKPALTPARFARALDLASNAFDVPAPTLLSRQRPAPIARARLALYAALYLAFDTSSTEIAARVQRDHTTVLDGIRRAMRHAKADPDYAAALGQIVNEVSL